MKKFISLVLALTIVLGSLASAAPGDIIHTATKKVYKADSEDLANAISSGVDINKFYKEVYKGKFVNIVTEEEEQLKYMGILTKENNLRSPEDLKNYMKKNESLVKEELGKISNSFAKSFDDINDSNKGSLSDYFGSSQVPTLTSPENYSIPVPGSEIKTSQIINLTPPKGLDRWIYKLGKSDFNDLKINEIVEDTKQYFAGSNINVELDDYLLLGAVDRVGRLKSYTSIKIVESMVKMPPVPALKDENINASFSKSTSHSGATKVEITKGHDEGIWKLALLNKEAIYEDSKFENARNYEENIHLPLASDEEVDNDLKDFKKTLIIFKEKDGKIEKYNIFEIKAEDVSGILPASKKLIKKTDNNPKDYNYTSPEKAKESGNTKISDLQLRDNIPEASKWMYTVVRNQGLIPNLDRLYENSKDYQSGKDIKVEAGDYLILLATDDNNRVKAYEEIPITSDMIKDPLATELIETTDYAGPIQGDDIGKSKFDFLKPINAITWKYILSDENISIPELNSSLPNGAEDIVLDVDKTKDISIQENQEILKQDNFEKNMMVYGLNNNGIQFYKSFTIDHSNVKMPEAKILEIDKHYSNPIKGTRPNSTRFTSNFNFTGLPEGKLKYKYDIVHQDQTIAFNQQFYNLRDLRPNTDINASLGKYLLILVVDNTNKTKAYKTIKLEFNNLKAGNAEPLVDKTNYEGPSIGKGNNTTQFTYLKLPSGADKFVYKIANKSFGPQEAGSRLTDTKAAKENEDIDASVKEFLLLLAVDSDDKIIASKEFKLSENQVKGDSGTKLLDRNLSLLKGNKPSSTKLELDVLGLKDPDNTRWRYKLLNNLKDGEVNYEPYFMEIVNAEPYEIDSDIFVEKQGDNYGQILVLATDNLGRTKAYKYVTITSDHVREHAPKISDNLKLVTGSALDSVNFENLPDGNFSYLISDKKTDTPAIGYDLPQGVVTYNKTDNKYNDITINIGKYLSLYEVDNSDKILKFNLFEVTEVQQASAELKLVKPDNLLEGDILNGGSQLTIELTGASWSKQVTSKTVRDKLFRSFKANSEVEQWNKLVDSMIFDGEGVLPQYDEKKLTINLPQSLDYDISKDQEISLIIDPEAIEGAINPVEAKETIIIKPTIGAKISGDLVDSIVREDHIKAGGKTIVISLDDGIWANDVSSILKALDNNSYEGNWKKITDKVSSKDITRNSGRQVTITLPKVSDVDFGINREVISLKINKDLISGAVEDVVASPNFTLYPNNIKIEAVAIDGQDSIALLAPDYRTLSDNNIWLIELSSGTLKDKIGDKDIELSGLPRGLKANISKVTNKNQLEIKLTGNASAALENSSNVKLIIKASAINEANSIDSDEIDLILKRSESIIDELKKVKVDVVGEKLMDATIQLENEDIEFSLNSTDGKNGEWTVASKNNTENITFTAGRVFLRQKSNPKVFYEVARLVYPRPPSGISVDKVEYGEDDKVKVNLTGFDINLAYQISLDGEATWEDFTDTSSTLSLGKDSDLRIRLKATKDDLASQASGKLNGLYLGDVKLDVGSELIRHTNNSMEYGRNLDKVSDKNWIRANVNETPIDLKYGDVIWIRERNSNTNFRKFVSVDSKTPPSEATMDNISYNIKENKIKNHSKENLQYKINGSTWKDLNEESELTDLIFTAGPIEIRTKGSSTELASSSKLLVSIPEAIDPPQLKGDDDNKTISYLNDKGIWKPIDKNFQYKVGANGAWKSGEKFKEEDSKNDTVVIYVRKSASKDRLPSKEKAISFTKNLTFENIIFDIAGKSILGTSTDMEYSINSNDSFNGIWETASNKATNIEAFEGMYIWLREKNKPLTQKLYIENLKRQEKPELSYVYYNIGTKKLSNSTSYNLEYRVNNGTWIKLDAKEDKYGVEFQPGKLEFRQRATNDKMASHPSLKTTIKSKSSGPLVKKDDVKNKITNIQGYEDKYKLLEYSINNGPWISGELLKTEDFSGDKSLKVRIKSTWDKLESQITEVDFTKNLELESIKFSTHIKPFKLNGVTERIQYNINGAGWKDANPDNNGNSTLLRMDGKTYLDTLDPVNEIWIRDKEQTDNKFQIYPKQP